MNEPIDGFQPVSFVRPSLHGFYDDAKDKLWSGTARNRVSRVSHVSLKFHAACAAHIVASLSLACDGGSL